MGTRHELSGVRVDSELLLQLAAETSPCALPDLHVRLSGQAAPPAHPQRWLIEHCQDDGVPWLSIARLPGRYLLRAHDVADFLLDAVRGEILCTPVPGCPLEVVAQVFVDRIFPFVLHASGRFSFHASAVALGDRGVVAFLGNAGLGKSTLASSLAHAASQGAAIFSDDCLAATLAPSPRQVIVHASYPAARLWPPSAEALFGGRELPFVSPRTHKRRVGLPPPRAALPLLRMYLLERGDGPPAIRPLRRRDALAALAAHLLRLDVEDRGRLIEEVAFLEEVVGRVVVAKLTYQRDFAELPAVHAAIRDDLEALPTWGTLSGVPRPTA